MSKPIDPRIDELLEEAACLADGAWGDTDLSHAIRQLKRGPAPESKKQNIDTPPHTVEAERVPGGMTYNDPHSPEPGQLPPGMDDSDERN